MSPPASPPYRLAIKLGAVVIVAAIVFMTNCSDQALVATLLVLLVMAGEAGINDVLPWLNGDGGVE